MKPKVVWKSSIDGRRNVSARAPVLHGDSVLASRCYDLEGFYESVLQCLDAESGVPRWEFKVRHVGNQPVISADGAVYWSVFDGNVYAFERDGSPWWKAPGTGTNVWVPCLLDDGGLVFAENGGSARRTWCLDASTGAVRWKFENGGHSYALAAAGGRVLHTTNREGTKGVTLYCLAADTGSLSWTVSSAEWMFRPRVHRDVVYVGGRGHLRAYGLADGRLIAAMPIDGNAEVYGLALADERFYFGDAVGRLRCVPVLSRADGGPGFATAWAAQVEGAIEAEPCVVDGCVTFLSKSGLVIALDAATGQERRVFNHGKGKDVGGVAAKRDRLYVSHGRDLVCYAC